MRATLAPALGLISPFAVVAVVAFVACVDGTTPDCADAAAQCGPNLDGAPGEGGLTDAVTTPVDAGADAPDAQGD